MDLPHRLSGTVREYEGRGEEVSCDACDDEDKDPQSVVQRPVCGEGRGVADHCSHDSQSIMYSSGDCTPASSSSRSRGMNETGTHIGQTARNIRITCL